MMSLVGRSQRTGLAVDWWADLRIRLVREWFYLSSRFTHKHLSEQKLAEWRQHLTNFSRDTAVQENAQQGAFALVAVGQNEKRHFLLQWNANWNMFNLIGGKLDNDKGDANSFLYTIQRELEEELGLTCPGDCSVVREISQLKMRQFSRREQRAKNYHFSIFEVSIAPMFIRHNGRPNFAARWLSTGRENVFVSAAEINELCTKDGRPISSTTRHILQEIEELPHFSL